MCHLLQRSLLNFSYFLVSESSKRKKVRSRSSAVLNSNYSKDHLDAWLETCLKDASTAQLSSSTEFLDYNPTNSQSNKKPFPQQQQQPQQQLLFQHQYSLSSQQPTTSSASHHHHHHLPNNHKDNLQNFTNRGMSYGGYPAPFSQGFQKVSMKSVTYV